MKALQIDRKVAKFAAARIASMINPGAGAKHGPLEFITADAPALPADGWVRLRPRLAGICGSDLATIDGVASRYFEPIVSFPFVPGHEVVADTTDGKRVVVVPVLTCETRGITPACTQCAAGRINLCERIAFGHLTPGLQTGFCTDTGGGWSTDMVAHTSQLVEVPAELTDEEAVLVEPTACAVHAATFYRDEPTAIIGAGTLGLLTLAAIGPRRNTDNPLVVTARYPHQRAYAKAFGATTVCESGELPRVIRSLSSSMAVGDQLTGGFPLVIDCVGSSDTIAQALHVCAPGGRILLVGMPSTVKLDLTGLWHREVAIQGCYAYQRGDFDAAIELVKRLDLGRLVSQTYPLADYADAIDHAANAGRRGAVKIAFDLRNEKK